MTDVLCATFCTACYQVRVAGNLNSYCHACQEEKGVNPEGTNLKDDS